MWIFYAVSGLIILWIYDFIKKVVVEKWYNKYAFLLVSSICSTILSFIYFIYSWIFEKSTVTSLIGLASWVWDFIVPIAMITALQYLSSSSVFIIIRLLSSVLVLFIGVFVLNDSLSVLSFIWFLLWFVVFWLLYDSEKSVWKDDFRSWFRYILIAVAAITLNHSLFKNFVDQLIVSEFIFIKMSVAFIGLSIFILICNKHKEITIKNLSEVLIFSFINSSLFVWFMILILPKIYLLWPLSLSYKTLSYSIIIPILFSIIVYKEKIMIKTILAFIFTIISLALFLY